MKVAIPLDGDQVNQHFGQSKHFVVAEIEQGQVITKEILDAAQLQHNHGGLSSLLTASGVTAVIVGGIGQPARQALLDNGLTVIRGARGPYREVLHAYAAGKLQDENVSCHHGDSHHHH